MKILDVIKTANQNLFRNKARSILTIIAIFVGSLTILLTTAINAGVDNFIDQQTASYGGEGILNITVKNTAQTPDLSGSEIREYNETDGTSEIKHLTNEDVKKIEQIDGIKGVTKNIMSEIEYITSPKTNKKFRISARPLHSDSINVDLVAGNSIKPKASEYEIILPPEYATTLGFSSDQDIIGQNVTIAVKQPTKCYSVTTVANCISTIDAKVVGVQAPSVISTGNAWISEGLNNHIFDVYQNGMSSAMKDSYTIVSADAEPSKINEIKDKLNDSGFEAMTIADTANDIKSFFDVILTIFTIFGYIALAAAAIGIINTLLMSVQERTREIGLNKALGMSSGKIFLIFSFEAILLGFWGSLVGILVAMGVGTLLNKALHISGGLLETFPTLNIVDFTLPNIITIVLVIMGIAFLAGTIPAIKAARKNPIDALRYE